MKRTLIVLALTLMALVNYGQKIPFQGKLTLDGDPVTGSRNFVFSINEIEWSETHEGVGILDGFYAVVLGSQTPLPSGLFDNFDEVSLGISVDGTAMSPITLYAPLRRSVLPRKTLITEENLGSSDTVFHIDINASANRGVQVDLRGQDARYALRGNVYTEAGETGGFKVGTFGSATGEGANDMMGLYGQAFGAGQFNVGARGVAGGTGNGATSFETGSYNNGVYGSAASNAWGNTGVYGLASGNIGVDNIGVVGRGEVDNGSDTIRNVGVLGDAKGPGVNVGIQGMASGGVKNWAGLFFGDVNVDGQLTVNGEPISGGGITGSDSLKVKDIKLENELGKLRTHVNIFNNAGSLVLNGNNDSTNVILGSTGGGYSGYLGIYDSLRYLGARLSTTNKGVGNLFTYDVNHKATGWFGNQGGTGGFMQLAGYGQDGVYTGATYTGLASWNFGLPYFIMEGSSEDPFTTLLYMGAEADPDNARESGVFELNSKHRVIDGKGAAFRINIGNDPNGSDPTGEAAEMFLWGSNTPNFQIGGKFGENTDLPSMGIFGSKNDGNGWFLSNINFDVWNDGVNDAGALHMYNTIDGVSSHTVDFTSNGNANSGQLSLNAPSGQGLVLLNNRGGNTGQAQFFGNTSGLRSEIGAFGDDSGFMILYGPNGNKNIQIDRDFQNTDYGQITVFGSDGITGKVVASAATDGLNEFGTFFVDGPTGGVVIDGLSGNVNAVGAVFADQLFSTDGTVSSSDERLKKNIEPLEGALEKTRKLRGVSYNWKDASKSQGTQIGVIAQELEEVYPEFVHTKEDGLKGVNYAHMVAVLIEAIKELDSKVASLEAENQTLKTQLSQNTQSDIDELRAEIESIKTLLIRPTGLGSVETGTK